jgi:ubiquinone/menaquinone biosynthesis C-methylase UbiE
MSQENGRPQVEEEATARRAQDQFGPQARFYAESTAFSRGEGLDAVAELAAMGRYQRTLDLGTGAGFTAFTMSPYSEQVLATDIAPEMIAEVRRLAAERGLDNVRPMMVESASLPFVSGSIDAVTCRQAAHHFLSVGGFLTEVWRVLKTDAPLILSDPVSPEDNAVASWMHDIEMRRDASHQRDLTAREWFSMLEENGFELTHACDTKVHLEFNDWVQRSATPEDLVEPLRRDFLTASAPVVDAFGIRRQGDEISFSWDVLVLRAVKRIRTRH